MNSDISSVTHEEHVHDSLLSPEMNVLINSEDALRMHRTGSGVFVDVRPEQEFQHDHIAGAVNMPLMFSYLLTDESGGIQQMVLSFARLLSEAGISNSDTIVLYENNLLNGFGKSCRGHFILKLLGHKNVRVLEGGFDEWSKDNCPVSTHATRRSRTCYKVELDARSLASKEDVLTAVLDKNAVLIDCRDEEEWSAQSSSPYGKDFCPRMGHIPGAVWLNWRRLFTHDGLTRFRTRTELLRLLLREGIVPSDDVILYCFKGSRAAAALLALKLAGIQRVRNYFGSWNEWSRDLALPIDSNQSKS